MKLLFIISLIVIIMLLITIIICFIKFNKLCKKKNHVPIDTLPEYIEPTEMINNDGELLTIGMRVICRSNEPDPLIIGTIEYIWDNNGKFKDCPIPHIKDENTGEIWGIMGICKPYTDELYNELLPLKPIEQLNYLMHPMAQINEKYGEYYKTFPERNLFKNIRTDENGNQIGMCRTCGAKDILIKDHKCPPQYNF